MPSTLGKCAIPLSGAFFLAAFASPSAAQNTIGLCHFDIARLSFAGTDIEQARCLLSRVHIDARAFGPAPERLGPFLEGHVGAPVTLDRARLRRLLTDEDLDALAATVDVPLSRARNNNPSAPVARYFVIHDTSQKIFESSFPPDDSARLNGLGSRNPRTRDWVAHTFTNRLGKVFLAYDYAIPWRATQFETQSIPNEAVKGLFLNNELNQPRRRDPAYGNRFVTAPTPAFTPAQYDRLALLYILASARAGRWLIPAYHGVLDGHIEGAHDDPQNFDLGSWEGALTRRMTQLGEPR